MKRKILKIDEDKCNGCGLCANACAEGAIAIVNGKARLVKDSYCDGLGACIGKCPQDALTIVEREADAFDEHAVAQYLTTKAAAQPASRPAPTGHRGCPGSALLQFAESTTSSEPRRAAGHPSELRQWPIQLHLVPVEAPYWQDADLLIAADCVTAASPDFHGGLLRGRRLIIACPKLDDTSGYVDKLAAIFSANSIRSVTVARMEVPCCMGLVRLVQAALHQCDKPIPFATVTVGIRGQLLSDSAAGGCPTTRLA